MVSGSLVTARKTLTKPNGTEASRMTRASFQPSFSMRPLKRRKKGFVWMERSTRSRNTKREKRKTVIEPSAQPTMVTSSPIHSLYMAPLAMVKSPKRNGTGKLDTTSQDASNAGRTTTLLTWPPSGPAP